MTIRPIFLLSLPRSGSTLIQRVIAAHPAVATASEPWVLLPLFSALEPDMCAAKYGHGLLVKAVDDVCNKLKRGREGYFESVRSYASELYGQLATNEETYFLDKTPRYHLIAHHLIHCFPDAKFILLWRNPLATLGSWLHSYGGVWKGRIYRIDLYEGLFSLIDAYQSNAEKICSVQYEKLILEPEKELRKVFDYLELGFDSDLLKNFSTVALDGSMGDKTGISEYSALNDAPLEKWKQTLANPIRKSWSRKYLHTVGEDRLTIMGYDYKTLLDELDQIPLSWKNTGSDIARMLYGAVIYKLLPGFKDQYGPAFQ